MTADNYLLYLLVSAGYIASPGPAVFVAINGGAASGVKNTVPVLLGNTIGLGALALISALGIGAFILGSDILTIVVKIIGALWLAYLGVKMIAADASGAAKFNNAKKLTRAANNANGFSDGLILALTNPKPVIFFTSIYPQFIIANGHENQQLMLLGLTFMGLSFALLNLYSLFSQMTIGKVLSAHRVRVFNLVFGIIFIVLALFLIAPTLMNI